MASQARNHVVLREKDRHTTRFISLAKVKNSDNKKYLYALQLKSMIKMDSKELNRQPEDVSESPYLIDDDVVQAREMEVQTDQFFFDVPQKKKENRKRSRKSIEQKVEQKRHREYAPCWFCLGNPKVEKHLVVSVGLQTYLAMPRGPLTPDHLLLLPVGHHQSARACPKNVLEEIEKYKKALRQMYKQMGKVMVVFERNYKSHHLQLQIVPVPLSVAGECKRAFIEGAKNMGIEYALEEIPYNTDIEMVAPVGTPYFSVELPSKERLFGRITKKQSLSFDLQFGRTVLASSSILNCPDRVNWHNCTESHDIEAEMTDTNREAFAPFDFSDDLE